MHEQLSIISSPTLILEGLKLLWHRQIRWLVIIPLVINILLFVSATGVAIQWFSGWVGSIMSLVPDWLQWLVWIIWGLFAALALVIYAFTFTLVANLIGSPFYGLIAERVILMLGDNQTSVSTASMLKIAWASFARQLQLMAYLIPRSIAVGLLCLVISFIPLANIVVPAVAGCWAAWSLSLQYLDYPADIEQVGFGELRQRAGAQRWQSLGFGFSALAASAIPLLNLLLLPATVIGGTILWVRTNGLETVNKKPSLG